MGASPSQLEVALVCLMAGLPTIKLDGALLTTRNVIGQFGSPTVIATFVISPVTPGSVPSAVLILLLIECGWRCRRLQRSASMTFGMTPKSHSDLKTVPKTVTSTTVSRLGSFLALLSFHVFLSGSILQLQQEASYLYDHKGYVVQLLLLFLHRHAKVVQC